MRQYEDKAFLEWFERLDRVTFHMCMHGGRRAKNTRLLATPDLYSQLAIACDAQHDHAPWGITKVGNSLQYDTAAEAEYPPLLCKRMADLLAKAVQLPLPPTKETTSSTSRRVLGNHVKQAPPLVPEFAAIIEMSHEPKQPNHRCLTSHVQGQNTEMDQQKDQQNTEMDQQKDQEHGGKKAKKTFRVGIQQEPQDFLKAAMSIPHPMSPQKVLPASLKAALFDNLTMDPVQLARSRMQAVVTIKEMAKDLEQEEAQAKAACTESVRKVLSSKRIALWESLLKASAFQDMDIVQIVKRGADLTGEPSSSPLFPCDWKPARRSSWKRQFGGVKLCRLSTLMASEMLAARAYMRPPWKK